MKKRADGRYCKQILVGYKPDGKRIMKSIYGRTIKEVEKQERELRNQIDSGLVISSKQNITLAEWADLWLNTYKNNVSYNTKSMYANAIQVHITPTLGNIPVSKIKPVQIQGLINTLVEKGSIRTAEVVKLTLEQLFRQAVTEGYINKNVTDGLNAIKRNDNEKRTLTAEEIEAIKKADLTSKQRLFIDIMRYCGLRKGEALALTIEDIDLENHSLSVNKSLYHADNNAHIKEPKSKAGYRTIPLIDVIYDELKAYIDTLNDTILFSMTDGSYMTKSSYRKFWDGIMKAINKVSDAEINFTAHTCRHSYATDLYFSKVDVKTAQYLLGHSSLQMTLGVYTHIDEDHIRSEIEKFNQYLA